MIWRADPCRPFHYDNSRGMKDGKVVGHLWIQLPLRDEDMFDKLVTCR